MGIIWSKEIEAAQPFFAIGKARIGFNQILAIAARMNLIKTIIRQADIWPDHTDSGVDGFTVTISSGLNNLNELSRRQCQCIFGRLPGAVGVAGEQALLQRLRIQR